MGNLGTFQSRQPHSLAPQQIDSYAKNPTQLLHAAQPTLPKWKFYNGDGAERTCTPQKPD
jgi:hypothetical protein